MDYEQKYKESLERAKEWMAGKYGHYVSDTPQEIAEFIFPELKESEDEQIRKELLEHCINRRDGKQVCVDANDYRRWADWLEKQGEQKPADKVEPKFHEGDWIVNKFHDICLITDIDLENSYYICKSNRFDNTEGDIDLTDKEFHLWTIEDARDGDVLVASDGSVFIFARVDGYGCIHHIALANDGVLKINPRLIFSWENVKGVKPATKEQRDLLFAKMHEAGYEWDADKRELTKK